MKSCASLVMAAFLSAVLLGPSRAAAEYRDRSDELPFGGGTGIVLVAVGIAVVTLVTVLVVKSSRAKPPPEQGAGAGATGALPSPELRVAEDFLVRAEGPHPLDLRLDAPFAGEVGQAPHLDPGALAVRF